MPDIDIAAVNSPAHYQGAGGLEAIEIIEALAGVDGHLPSAVKYILRHKHKGRPAEDLAKARWYVRRVAKSVELPRVRSTWGTATPLVSRAAVAFGFAHEPAHDALVAIVMAMAGTAEDRRRNSLERALAHLDTAIRALDTGGAA